MRTFVFIVAFISISVLLGMSPRKTEAKCTVCHSKNPKMVRMHEALEFKRCFDCHFKDRIAGPREMPRQMRTDPLCKDCHSTGPLPNPLDLKSSPSGKHGPLP